MAIERTQLYRAGQAPVLEASKDKYIQEELRKIEQAFATLDTNKNWRPLATWEYDGTPTWNVDFIGLGSFTDLLVFARNLTLDTLGTRNVRVSDVNGATFKDAMGDYINLVSAGTETPSTSVSLHSTATLDPRTGILMMSSLSSFPVLQVINRSSTVITNGIGRISGVRVYAGSGGNINGGTITILGR